jgi:hypothetical protein
MRTKKVIKNLEVQLKPYQPFLIDWSKQEACLLTQDDLYIIEMQIKNKFKINLFEIFMFYNQGKYLIQINKKLTYDYKKFKEWMILKFLFSLVELARNNQGQKDLHKPIGLLNINDELKKCLLKLNVITINQIFEKYTETDLEKPFVFKTIIEFETTKKLTH